MKILVERVKHFEVHPILMRNTLVIRLLGQTVFTVIYLIRSFSLVHSGQFLSFTLTEISVVSLFLLCQKSSKQAGQLASPFLIVFLFSGITQVNLLSIVTSNFHDQAIIYTTYSTIQLYQIFSFFKSYVAQLSFALIVLIYYVFQLGLYSELTSYFLFAYMIANVFMLHKANQSNLQQISIKETQIQECKQFKQIMRQVINNKICLFQFNNKQINSQDPIQILFETPSILDTIKKQNLKTSFNLVDSILVYHSEKKQNLSKIIRDKIQDLDSEKLHSVQQVDLEQCEFNSQSHFNFQDINMLSKSVQTNPFSNSLKQNHQRLVQYCEDQEESKQNQDAKQDKEPPLSKKDIEGSPIPKTFSVQIKIIQNKNEIYVSVELTVLEECFKQYQEEIAQLNQLIQLRENILVTVAHDFKSPINGMLGIIEQLIQQNNINQMQQYHLALVKKNVDLLLYMIGDLLDFQRIQNDKLKLCLSSFNLMDIVQEAQKKQIKFIKKIEESLDSMVYSDPYRLKQIFHNLISNALKYTQRGQITIEIYDMKSQFQKRVIGISIKDTGVGIPENIKSQLFNMYATFDHHKGLNKNGVGLGLTITKKLVGILGPVESVELESDLGVGSTFTFYIYSQCDQSSNLSSHQSNKYISVNNIDSAFQQVSQVLIYQRKQDNQEVSNFQNRRAFSYNQQQQSNNEQVRQRLTVQQKSQFVKQEVHIQPFSPSDKEQDVLLQQLQLNDEIEEDEYGHKKEKLHYFTQKNIQTFNNLKGRKFTEKNSLPSFQYFVSQKNEPVILEQQGNSSRLSDHLTYILRGLFQNGLNLLVVDDEPLNILAFKLSFQKFTLVQIDEAYDGEQALKLVQIAEKLQIDPEHFYDCIIMDLTMPILDGWQTANKIKAQISRNFIPDTKLIALSGYDDEREKQRCYDIGFDAFLSKPVKPESVIQVLQQLFQYQV